jgi:hypothetical protein
VYGHDLASLVIAVTVTIRSPEQGKRRTKSVAVDHDFVSR